MSFVDQRTAYKDLLYIWRNKILAYIIWNFPPFFNTYLQYVLKIWRLYLSLTLIKNFSMVSHRIQFGRLYMCLGLLSCWKFETSNVFPCWILWTNCKDDFLKFHSVSRSSSFLLWCENLLYRCMKSNPKSWLHHLHHWYGVLRLVGRVRFSPNDMIVNVAKEIYLSYFNISVAICWRSLLLSAPAESFFSQFISHCLLRDVDSDGRHFFYQLYSRYSWIFFHTFH